MVLSDDADALFFRAVDRDRHHNMPACPLWVMQARAYGVVVRLPAVYKTPMKVSYFVAAAVAAMTVIHVHAQQPNPQAPASAARPVDPKIEARIGALKTEGAAGVEDLHDFTQKMVDSVFSFGELGFQEVETSRYLTNILRQQGFTIEQGISGIPTAWMATWGSGKPVISLGSDIDGIPTGSQKPGVAYHDPFFEGGP
jgi:hypothetical protein